MKNSCICYSPKPSLERNARLAVLMLIVASVPCSGCGVLGVKPWDHDLLAERPMQTDPYPLQTGIDDHIYFSKEASSGGRSFAGGGCGCN